MKSNKSLILIPVLACLFGMTGCSKSGSDTPTKVEKNTFTLNESDKVLSFGDSFKLTAFFPKGVIDDITWTSTNDQIVDVNDNGLVSAKSVGVAYVVAETKDMTQKCKFTVTYGEYIPELIISNISDGEITIAKNQEFIVNGKVNYNNKLYETNYIASDYDQSVIAFNGNKIIAKGVGETLVKIKAEWNSMESEFLEKVIKVTVVDNISFYSKITVNGKTSITNSVDLSSVSSWCGKNYNTTCLIEPVIYINNQYHLAEFKVEDNDVVDVFGNNINAKMPGVNIVDLFYEDLDSGITYSSNIRIDVTCPIENYVGEEVKFSSEEKFPAEKYFGSGAYVISATQNGKDLYVHNDIIDGLDQLGAESKSLQIITNKGGYVFNDLFIYTRMLTKDNIFDTLLLNNKVISGYYILGEDIDNQIDFTGQKISNNKCYFAGTFDGQGHTLTALVGTNGIFGGLGNGTLIKDTKFVLTFENKYTTASYCGLANNNSIFINSEWEVELNNLYVMTTNFAANDHALFEYRPNNLMMYSNYIEINGADSLEDFNNVEQNYAALFRYDVTPLTGPASQYTGKMRSNFVVVSKFMPLANGDFTGMKGRYVSYAKNDEKYITNGDSTTMVHSLDRPDQSRYRIVYPSKTASDEQRKLYGFINVPELVSTGVIPDLDTPMAAFYSSTYSDGGISRFDSKENMTVSVVGSWEVK